jgi:hypothetical protein
VIAPQHLPSADPTQLHQALLALMDEVASKDAIIERQSR